MKKASFYNTFEPVVPLYDELLPFLKQNGINSIAVVSNGIYREKNEALKEYFICSWIPFFLRRHKRACALFYFLFTPFILLIKKSDVNIFLTQPPFFYIIGAFLSRVKKTPYMIHLMDMYPDLIVNAIFLKERSFFYKFLDRLGVSAYRNASKIVVIGECMKQRLIDKGIAENRISVVQNWALPILEPIPKDQNKFLSQNDLMDKFIVMYSGNMGHSHILDTILDAAKQLESEPGIIFVFIGSGTKRKLVKAAISNGAKNIKLFDYQPREFIAHSLSAADVHFLSLAEGFEGKVVPSKFYGILACGRPAIFEGNCISEIATAISTHKCGNIVSQGDIQNLSNIIMELYNNPLEVNKIGKKCFDSYNHFYHHSIAVAKYYEIVNEVIND